MVTSDTSTVYTISHFASVPKTVMPVPKHIFNQIKAIIPPLNGTLHKGQSGRVGVLGGALEYVAFL